MMRKPVEGLEDQRRTEILDACDKLYAEKDYSAITIKDISTITSFSRPSIYNYFATKEEIFLGLLTREYELWTQDMQSITDSGEKLSPDALASAIAHTLEKRITLLKISAMNLYEIEDNSSIERLKDFKIAFKAARDAMVACCEQSLGESEELATLIQYGFFPFTYGIYPYTTPTVKQIEAMKEVGVTMKQLTPYDLAYQFLKKIFTKS